MTISALFWARAMLRLRASDYVEWAVSMLEGGSDSPSLRILAGLDSGNLFEADSYFQRVLRELQIASPGLEDSARAYALELCEQILDGRLGCKEGVRQLYQIVLSTGYSEEYLIWLYLDDAIDNIEAGHYPITYPGLTSENLDETVCTEARRFMEGRVAT